MLFERSNEKRQLIRLAELIRERNETSAEIAALIGRPALFGHVGEYLASSIFDIQLEESASSKGIDGHFRAGPLAGKSVNVKWYGKQESLLDITPRWLPDFYLVMTGPKSSAASSRGTTRPWLIEYVYLFDAKMLVSELSDRKLKIGIATSVRQCYWKDAEIYPHQINQEYILSEEQKKMLRQFGQSVGNGTQTQDQKFRINIPKQDTKKASVETKDTADTKGDANASKWSFGLLKKVFQKDTNQGVVNTDGKIRRFVNDNEGYLKWLEDNPRSFVLNCEKNPNAETSRLHGSTCHWIGSNSRFKNWTNMGFIKLCSLEKGPLLEWAETHIEGELKSCKKCI